MGGPTLAVQAPLEYLLQLADNALILGQRNAEWCGHGPALEEDIAMANISLDLIGQARLVYQYAAETINASQEAALSRPGAPGLLATEDRLAYFRGPDEFRNYTLLELPHHGPLAATAAIARDYATTIVRNFFYSALMDLLWAQLRDSQDERLAAIAAKSVKELRYHLRHAQGWMLRLGDGTVESNRRMQDALDHLLPYTQEFWSDSPAETSAMENGSGMHPREVQVAWNERLASALKESGLAHPLTKAHVSGGKLGRHSEHLGRLLAEMQSVARAHPTATW